ncbi:MAG TPA: Hsp20/alpha crystallin family protein [candidate division Zixibacteria bacterium]|nr:Hsp20/alpha crystallin family protein [candidate division Zixibacteria bacterium]
MRALVPRGLFDELTSWHRDIDELFDRFFSSFGSDFLSPSRTWCPATDACVKDGRYIIRMDLPGVDPKDLDLSVVEGTLTVKGERKLAQEMEGAVYDYREIGYGRFERSLPLPKGVDAEKITARYEHGVLEISMPAAELAGRKIPIEVGASEVKQLKAA